MSELEKKNVNEMDAAEMLEGYRAENAVDAEQQEQTTEDWVRDMVREFDANARRWNHRQGWEAFGLCLVSGLTVVACCTAVLYGCWRPIVMGIAAANLLMAGAWWQKAKEGWNA